MELEDNDRQEVTHNDLSDAEWDSLVATQKAFAKTKAPWERDTDEYTPPSRLLDGEERYWPEWAFGGR